MTDEPESFTEDEVHARWCWLDFEKEFYSSQLDIPSILTIDELKERIKDAFLAGFLAAKSAQ